MSTLTIKPLTETVGAQVLGVDTSMLAEDHTLAVSILDALEHHGVLVFRGLHLEPEAQVAFCSRLGKVDYSEGHHPIPGIYRVSLDTSKNSSAPYLYATFDWHIDGCTPLNGESPQMATMLSAKGISAAGGDTEFASTYAAYDDLDQDEKDRLGDLRVLHTLRSSQSKRHPNPTEEQLARWRSWPKSEHPLVWTHLNGHKSLVIGASADHVVGVNIETGRSLLASLLARSTRPELVYRHKWSIGDTVIWDNRGVLHRAIPYSTDSPREMLRTTVLGDEPIR